MAVSAGVLAKCECGAPFIRTRHNEVCEDCTEDRASRLVYHRLRGSHVERTCECGEKFRPVTTQRLCLRCRLNLLVARCRICDCGTPVSPRRRRCVPCAKRVARDAKARRDRRRRRGEKPARRRCLDCPVLLPEGANGMTVRCREHQREVVLRRYRLLSLRATALRMLARMDADAGLGVRPHYSGRANPPGVPSAFR